MNQCPACNGKRYKEMPQVHSVVECSRCHALYGTCTLADSHKFVSPQFDPAGSLDGARYFDFRCVTVAIQNGEKFIKTVRRHGWFNPQTKLIVQVG